jgi:acetyltransferase-like isoleucine patch superfamily enzyme
MFLTEFQLKGLGLKSYGKDVYLSDKASIYNPGNISIGDNVRIDDFCVLSGGSGLSIGKHIHIAVHCCLFAGAGIQLHDFSTMGPFCLLLSESDDFSGRSLVGPQIPKEYKPYYKKGMITLGKYVTMGARSTVLPDVTIGEGSAVGAHSLVTKDCDPWWIYVGVPAKKLTKRDMSMIDLGYEFKITL